jgi:group I intron endonuclease
MRISGIYQIQSKINPDRIYIGSAININKRWNHHLSNLKSNNHHSIKLQNHYNKYGKEDLQFSILLECDKENLIRVEQYYIDVLNPYFNICKFAASVLGKKCSEATKKKISSHKRSQEFKDRMRNIKLGWHPTEEGIKNMSIAAKKRPANRKGVTLSIKTKKAVSDGLKEYYKNNPKKHV